RRSPKDLLLGEPILGFTDVTPQGSAGVNPSALVEEVRLLRTDVSPALKVTFKEHALIHFSDVITAGPGGFNNSLTILNGGFEFESFDYFVDERSLEGALSSFNVIIERGLLQSRDALFQIGQGSQLAFRNIEF